MHPRSKAAAYVSAITVIAGFVPIWSATAAIPPAAAARTSSIGSASAQVHGGRVTVAAPRGAARGDLQVVTIGVANPRARVATPQGWSKVRDQRFARFRAFVFASHSTAPATFTKTRRASWRANRTTYRGASSIASARLHAARGAAHRTPSLTSSGPTTMLVEASVQTDNAGRVATLSMVLRKARSMVPVTARPSGVVLARYAAGEVRRPAAAAKVPLPTPTPTPTGTVLWDGGFDRGGVPAGRNGSSCETGSADGPNGSVDVYGSVEQMGNSACTDKVEFSSERTRTADSSRALKMVMGAHQQREQLQSTYSWRPDGSGSVQEWYGFSLFYDRDWDLGGGLLGEVSGSYWHNPIAFRTEGGNGSMNFSGDMNLDNANGRPYPTFSTPHMVLRRNTVLNQEGFYSDGLGLDKLDLGPIVTGRWMDFVCHIRWSTTRTNALRECWRDGIYMGAKTSLNAVSSNKHTLRVGIYQTTAIDHRRTTYADNVRIGTSYAAVDPSRVR